jgi:hypothetical protein
MRLLTFPGNHFYLSTLETRSVVKYFTAAFFYGLVRKPETGTGNLSPLSSPHTRKILGSNHSGTTSFFFQCV